MAKYKYALNTHNSIISAADIAGKPVTESYACIGCGNAMIARVNGQIKAPHFAHKAQVECSGETYLHKLGKKAFFDTYRSCLDSGEPFNITLNSSKICKKMASVTRKSCTVGEVKKTYDLTDYYQDIFIEKKHGEFIADVLLSSKTHPDRKILIEIACTHFLSEKKSLSEHRIIEIPIDSEEDIEKIKKAHLSPSDAMFLGFNLNSETATDSECRCAGLNCHVFYVYKNGKARLETTQLLLASSNIEKTKSNLLYHNIILEPESDTYNLNAYIDYKGQIFVEQVELAVKKKIDIKNCYACRYHGENWSYSNNHSIYCKYLKKSCSSNQAADCEFYRIDLGLQNNM